MTSCRIQARGAREGLLPGEQLVQHHAEEKISLRASSFFPEACPATCRRSCPAPRPAALALGKRAGGIGGCVRFQFGQAEVRELRVAVLGDQDVGRLDVAMQNARVVRRGQSIGDARQQFHDLPPSRLFAVPNP